MAAGVSMLSDLSRSPGAACSGDDNGAVMGIGTAIPRVPTAKYTKMGETLRHVIPGHMQCSMACGGKACKYENPSRWTDEEQAIKGLYSSWVTDNLLAMARPSTEIIEKYNIIEQFKRFGLMTIINLQRPGEHASCGNPLEQESGFTYRPETLMEAGIYYYNFGWKDYGVASLTTILDMVKVMAFAAQEGKMAVHCHAGLGRTGVLLACFLVFTSRMTADQAILFVRAKRPNSIQTRGQLLCVREFAQFLVPLRSVFSCIEPKTSAVTLSQYLTRQRHLLHGYEARQMKNVPKIVQLVCRLLIDIADNRQVMMEDEWREIPDLTAEVEKTVSELALQQLGNEMRGKGIPVHFLSPTTPQERRAHGQPLMSDSELDSLWQQHNVRSHFGFSLSDNRRLSFSDSVLHKLGQLRQDSGLLKTNPPSKHSCSHSSLYDQLCTPHPRTEAKIVLKLPQHSLSLDLEGEEGISPHVFSSPTWFSINNLAGCEEERPAMKNTDTGPPTHVPFITLQPELPKERRCLLVAKALAMDGTNHALSAKVAAWQMELNCREGAWERLCLERDPMVLSGLMWAWLEQLKDPVISSDDILALSEKKVNPQKALDSLQKAQRVTLLCVLNCAANLLLVPAEVENRFLEQAIKVFTKIDPLLDQYASLYGTLKTILTPVLNDLRSKRAMEDSSAS